MTGFQRRTAPLKPSPFAGARRAPANGARSEYNYIVIPFTPKSQESQPVVV